MSGEVKREIFERGHAAVLLPFDPERDEVVLVEQIRIAAYDTSVTPWLLEMVAGMIEEGETIEAVARRRRWKKRADRRPHPTGHQLPGESRRNQRALIYSGG